MAGTGVKVNTGAVRSTASVIEKVNNDISKGLSDPNGSMGTLERAWTSPVASSVIGRYREISGSGNDDRYKVMDGIKFFLLQQIGEGYEQTEDVNTKLAEAFK